MSISVYSYCLELESISVLDILTGYGILRLNYVGSTGGTSDVTEMLCGKIGVTDVEDCQATVQSLLSQEQNLDPSKIVAHGGSHGKP